MSDVQRNLMPGEKVLCRAKLHWIVYVGPAIMALIGLVFIDRWYGMLLLLLAATSSLESWIRARTTEFVVTNRRVIAKRGIISRHTHETSLTQLEALGVSQGVWGRLLNYGSITVTGTGGTPQTFPQVADPLKVREVVYSQVDTGSRHPAATSAVAPAEDIVGQLERLANLHRQGVLSDAEFKAQKGRLMAGA